MEQTLIPAVNRFGRPYLAAPPGDGLPGYVLAPAKDHLGTWRIHTPACSGPSRVPVTLETLRAYPLDDARALLVCAVKHLWERDELIARVAAAPDRALAAWEALTSHPRLPAGPYYSSPGYEPGDALYGSLAGSTLREGRAGNYLIGSYQLHGPWCRRNERGVRTRPLTRELILSAPLDPDVTSRLSCVLRFALPRFELISRAANGEDLWTLLQIADSWPPSTIPVGQRAMDEHARENPQG